MRLKQDYTPRFWLFRTSDLIAHYTKQVEANSGYEESNVSDMAKALLQTQESLRSIAQNIKDHGIDLITVGVKSETYPAQDVSHALMNNGYAIAFNHLSEYYGAHDEQADHTQLYPAGAYYEMEDVRKINTARIATEERLRDDAKAGYIKERHGKMIDFLDAFSAATENVNAHPAGSHVRFERSFNHDQALQNHVRRVKDDLDNNKITFALR